MTESPASSEALLDIYFANDLREPVWIASAREIEAARSRMRLIAQEEPGWYFVWDSRNLRVIARIDTTQVA
jgi:hypothetical protein